MAVTPDGHYRCKGSDKMKRYLRATAAGVLALLMAVFTTCGQVRAEGMQKEPSYPGEIYCTILGDSIAKGYSSDKSAWIECYGRIAVKEIAKTENCRYGLMNFAKNGLASEGMNEKILTQKRVLCSLDKSDLILITLGSNDLLNECKSVVQNILKTDTKFKSADEALEVLEGAVKKNPLLILNIIDALSNWDYVQFESQWIRMMDTINSIKKDDAQIIVTELYNPVVNMKLPSTMNQVVEDIISNMNSIIRDHAQEYGYGVAELSDSTISVHVQDDGLHPDQQGQEIIADLVCEEYRKMTE